MCMGGVQCADIKNVFFDMFCTKKSSKNSYMHLFSSGKNWKHVHRPEHHTRVKLYFSDFRECVVAAINSWSNH